MCVCVCERERDFDTERVQPTPFLPTFESFWYSCFSSLYPIYSESFTMQNKWKIFLMMSCRVQTEVSQTKGLKQLFCVLLFVRDKFFISDECGQLWYFVCEHGSVRFHVKWFEVIVEKRRAFNFMSRSRNSMGLDKIWNNLQLSKTLHFSGLYISVKY